MTGRPTLVLSDAGPLIALGKLNRLDLLALLYLEVRIPKAVYEEVVVDGLARGMEDARNVQLFWQQHGWPIDDHHLLALAMSTQPDLVLLDDEMARAEARRHKLQVKGTLGVLVACYRQRHLTMPDLDLLFEQIATRTDIWISEKLCRLVLEELKALEVRR